MNGNKRYRRWSQLGADVDELRAYKWLTICFAMAIIAGVIAACAI